jgi:hypothetical protein
MKGDLVLRIIVSFLVPLLLLFSFYAIVSYNVFGFYSFALSLLYILLGYLLLFLRHKYVGMDNLTIFKIFGRVLVSVFIVFLVFVLIILLNWKVPLIYDYIKF